MPLHYPEGPFVAQSDELQRLARESRFSMVKVAVAINFIAKIRREDLMNYLSISASASEAGYYTSVLCDRAHRLSQATVGSQTTDDVPDSGEAAVSGSLRVVHTWCKGRFFRPRERARGREVRRQPAASATVSSPHSCNTPLCWCTEAIFPHVLVFFVCLVSRSPGANWHRLQLNAQRFGKLVAGRLRDASSIGDSFYNQVAPESREGYRSIVLGENERRTRMLPGYPVREKSRISYRHTRRLVDEEDVPRTATIEITPPAPTTHLRPRVLVDEKRSGKRGKCHSHSLARARSGETKTKDGFNLHVCACTLTGIPVPIRYLPQSECRYWGLLKPPAASTP